MKGERGHQLRLASRLDAEVPALPGVEDLLDDFAKLVDFDGKDAAIDIAVAHGLDRVGKRLVDGLHAIAQADRESARSRGKPSLRSFASATISIRSIF